MYVWSAAHHEKCLSISNFPWILLGQLAYIPTLFFEISNRPISENLEFFRNSFLNISISFKISQNQFG